MIKKLFPNRKVMLFTLAWAGLCFLSATVLNAILWGAEPGLMSHLRYGALYLLSGKKRMLAELLLLSLGAGFIMTNAIRNRKAVFWPGVVLAAFFGLNTLIDQTPDGRLLNLLDFPGAGWPENILFWLTQLGSWYGIILLFCQWMAKPVEKGKELCKSSRRQLLWAGVMLLCWLPILILRSPGSIFRDTDAQILQFQGQLPFEASNPLLLSFVYGPLFTLGQRLSGDNGGILLCVLFQLGLGLYACSRACEEAAICRGSRKAGGLLCLFFGMAPNFASLTAAVLKDAIHGPIYLLFFLAYGRAADSDEKKDWVRLAVLAVLVSATRKGAVYLAAFSLLGLLLLRPNRKKLLLGGTCMLLAGHFCLNSLLYPLIGVEKPMEKENYSFFYPITGYYCARHDEELSPEEKNIIGAVLDYDTVRTGFSTRGVDEIKSTYHAQTPAQLQAYTALHGKFFLRHPLTCLEALVYSRNFYFTPWSVQGERITVSMSAFSEVKPGAESHFSYWLPEETRQRAEDQLWAMTDWPIVKELTSPGGYTWLCLLLLAAAMYQKDRRKKVLLLPLVLLTAGLLLTHLNGAVRYACPLMYCLPPAAVMFRTDKQSL